MSEPFVAEIRIFAGNFAPRGWAFCNGQLLPISQNTALFSLLGTMYGGNGQSTFGLPNLQGRAPMHQGSGPGLTSRSVGETGGQESVTLSETQIATHTHTATGDNSPSSGTNHPSGAYPARLAGRGSNLYGAAAALGDSSPLGSAGGSQPHTNMQPFLTVNYIIALQGVYPPRS